MGYKSQSPNISSACTYSDVAWDLRLVMVPRNGPAYAALTFEFVAYFKKPISSICLSIMFNNGATVRTDTSLPAAKLLSQTALTYLTQRSNPVSEEVTTCIVTSVRSLSLIQLSQQERS